MKKEITVVAAIMFTAIIPQAQGADLPSRPAPYAAPVTVPIYNWTGIYLGVNGGYGFGSQNPLGLISSDFSSFDYSANGWLAGGTFGAQIQSGHVVLGLEGDIDWTNIKGSGTGPVTKLGIFQGTGTISSNVSSISTIRARVGYAQDNWLFYGSGGVALTNATSEFTQTTGFACNNGVVVCTSPTSLHPGLAVGAGVEYGITQNLSTKLEYIWVGAGAVNTLKENMLRAGLNWRFGGN